MRITLTQLQEPYIYIFEDGTIKYGGKPSEDDLNSVDGGMLEIIHPATMTTYYGGDWSDIEGL